MAIKSPLPIILGLANVGDRSKDPTAKFDTPEEINAFFNVFYDRGGRQLDTARGYSPMAPGSSEPRLGLVGAGNRFSIDTKVNSRDAGSHSKENIEKEVEKSLTDLKSKIDVEYLHRPDRATPFEETVKAMDKAFKEGKFKRFGLSNFTAEEVEKVIKICDEKGYNKPTVYQGQYNPIVRGGEKELFPVLRKHGIAFYAWSPAAGGFFAGNHKKIQSGSRFDQSHFLGKFYSSMYTKPGIQKATDNATDSIAKHGINGHAAALRWTIYHSTLKADLGDSVIIGASSTTQLSSSLDMVEQGPLPQEVVDAMEGLYKQIEEGEIAYHF